MGMRNGKYDFQHTHSAPSLPIDGSEISSSILDRKARSNQVSLPKCLHRTDLNDSLAIQNENITLVWLDTNVHQRPSNIDTEVKLRNLIDYIRIFDRVDACEKYIKQIGKMNNQNPHGKKENILVVISTILAPTIIPHLHELAQVKWIYIYGRSKTISRAHQDWLRQYTKVNPLTLYENLICVSS